MRCVKAGELLQAVVHHSVFRIRKITKPEQKMKRIRNYGHVAETILAYVMRLNTEEIHVLLDTYRDDSLKYQERQRRGADDRAM